MKTKKYTSTHGVCLSCGACHRAGTDEKAAKVKKRTCFCGGKTKWGAAPESVVNRRRANG